MIQTAAIQSDAYTHTGNSETLKEWSFNKNPPWIRYIAKGLGYTINAFMKVNAPQNVRYLDASEQKVMKNALYRSARILHKAEH